MASGTSPFMLVTGNRNKLIEAERLLGFRPPARELDLPEIQELDLHTVLRAKAEAAWQRLQRPLVVDDTAFELAAMNGFPGPLVKWMLKRLGAEGLARSALALGEAGATARCALLYRDRQREVVAEGVTYGRVVAGARGDNGFGWDPIFLPDGHRRTYAEMTDEEKDRIGPRGRAWRRLLAELDPVASSELS